MIWNVCYILTPPLKHEIPKLNNILFVDSLKTANRIGTPVVLARGSKIPKNKYQNLGCQVHRTWSAHIEQPVTGWTFWQSPLC